MESDSDDRVQTLILVTPVEAERFARKAAAEILARRRRWPRAVIEEMLDPSAEIGEREFRVLIAIAADSLGRVTLHGLVADGHCYLPTREEERIVARVVARALRGTRVRRAHRAIIEVECVEERPSPRRARE